MKSLEDTGKIDAIENEKGNVLHQLCKIYGVGPKKAIELSKKVSCLACTEMKILARRTSSKFDILLFIIIIYYIIY